MPPFLHIVLHVKIKPQAQKGTNEHLGTVVGHPSDVEGAKGFQ